MKQSVQHWTRFALISLILVPLTLFFFGWSGKYLQIQLLITLLILLIAYFVISLIENWPKDSNKKAEISAQIVSFSFAALMVILSMNAAKTENKCVRDLQNKSQIIDALGKSTQILESELGQPYVCLNTNGGIRPIQFLNDEAALQKQEILKNYGALQLYQRTLTSIISSTVLKTETVDAWRAYADAFNELIMYCDGQKPTYHNLWRALNTANQNFIVELNKQYSDCLN